MAQDPAPLCVNLIKHSQVHIDMPAYAYWPDKTKIRRDASGTVLCHCPNNIEALRLTASKGSIAMPGVAFYRCKNYHQNSDFAGAVWCTFFGASCYFPAIQVRCRLNCLSVLAERVPGNRDASVPATPSAPATPRAPRPVPTTQRASASRGSTPRGHAASGQPTSVLTVYSTD